jgi:hypothetical protein
LYIEILKKVYNKILYNNRKNKVNIKIVVDLNNNYILEIIIILISICVLNIKKILKGYI